MREPGAVWGMEWQCGNKTGGDVGSVSRSVEKRVARMRWELFRSYLNRLRLFSITYRVLINQ